MRCIYLEWHKYVVGAMPSPNPFTPVRNDLKLPKDEMGQMASRWYNIWPTPSRRTVLSEQN